MTERHSRFVMPALGAGIHAFAFHGDGKKSWMAGPSPARTAGLCH
jgi:hypothetical protein